jgi:transcriptional regulator with XRE-family HTH domain
MAAEHSASSFAALLRQLRVAAGLTQEELAEAATISPRSVSDLERGINLTARKETARLLADALNLSGIARATFEAAARGRPPDTGLAGLGGVAAATRTLPRDATNFIGRERELGLVTEVLGGTTPGSRGAGAIFVIGGMAGVGKTATDAGYMFRYGRVPVCRSKTGTLSQASLPRRGAGIARQASG